MTGPQRKHLEILLIVAGLTVLRCTVRKEQVVSMCSYSVVGMSMWAVVEQEVLVAVGLLGLDLGSSSRVVDEDPYVRDVDRALFWDPLSSLKK